jgi:hypothetical protein
MFSSFKRKPDESTIAASQSPSVTLPTSPALKNQPNALGSAAMASRTSSGVPAGGTGSLASLSTANASSAAQANGFATGNYNTGGTTARPGMGMPPTNGYATAGMPNSNYSQSLTGPSSTSAMGTNPMGTNNPMGSSASSTPTGYAYNGGAPNHMSASSIVPSYPGSASASVNMPPSNSGPSLTTPPVTNQYAGLTPPPVGNYPMNNPSMPTYSPVGAAASTPSYTSAGPVGGYNQAATASISSANGYRPGSTARATAYDLGNPSSLGAGGTSTNPYSTGSMTTTASGTSSPGYMIPPSMQR